ncbi:MAG TPA: hypothetical protein VI322_01965 [Candidatus Saccharimonadia bacterium]
MTLRQLTAATLILSALANPIAVRADDTSSLLGQPTNSDVGTSSPNDSASLQPAGTSPLQSGTAGGGLTAPGTGTQLQGSTPSDGDLQVLGSEADGNRHDPNAATSWPAWVWVALVAGILLAGEAVLLVPILRRRFQRWRENRRARRKRRP